MSGSIHINATRPAWHSALRTGAVVMLLVGAAWYGLSDDGLPPQAASDSATPFVKATPLPAPTPLTENVTPASDVPHTAVAAGVSARAATPLAAAIDPDDYAARNAALDTGRLTHARPVTARAFLNEVLLQPGASSGFVVSEVLPESRYARMGLHPGDVIYSLDVPGQASVDESSMVALMQQTELQLEVYRNGTLTRLRTNLATEEGDASPR